jgi:enoyl-CoA hydratase/carnithine racemase
MISIDTQGTIAVLKLDNGKKNPIDPGMLGETGKALREFREDPEIRGLVLGSTSDRFFSIGFDIPHLFDLPREDFGGFYRTFTEFCLDLYTFPKPTAASVQGHATAGGFILTLACDYRIIADGHNLLGLNEAKLGVPVPHFSEMVLERVAGRANAAIIIEEGEFFLPEDALTMGLAENVLPGDEVLTAAINAVSGVDAGIMDTFSTIKGARTKKIAKAVREDMDERTHAFLDRWYAPEVRENLKEAMRKY